MSSHSFYAWQRTLEALAVRPDLPDVAASALATVPARRVRRFLSENPTLPESARQLLLSADTSLGDRVAGRSQDPEMLARAAASEFTAPALWAARHEATPPAALAVLAASPKVKIAVAALANPSTPHDAVMARASEPRVVERPALLLSSCLHTATGYASEILDAHPEVFDLWAGTSPAVLRAAARGRTRPEWLPVIASSTAHDLRDALASNPQVPTDLLAPPAQRVRARLDFEGLAVTFDALQARTCTSELALAALAYGSATLDLAVAKAATSCGDDDLAASVILAMCVRRPRIWGDVVGIVLAGLGVFPPEVSHAVRTLSSARRSAAVHHVNYQALMAASVIGKNPAVVPSEILLDRLGSDPVAWQTFLALGPDCEGDLAELAAASACLS